MVVIRTLLHFAKSSVLSCCSLRWSRWDSGWPPSRDVDADGSLLSILRKILWESGRRNFEKQIGRAESEMVVQSRLFDINLPLSCQSEHTYKK